MDLPSWRMAVAYWRDGGRYPRATTSGDDDPYLRAATAMVASLRRHVPHAAVEVHTNLTIESPGVAELVAAGATLVPTPFEHRMPPGYFDKFSASTYAIDVLAALADRAAPNEVSLLIDPDVVWLRHPEPLLRQAGDAGLVCYPIPYPPDFVDLGLTRRQLSDLAVEMTERSIGGDGLIAHLGGELVGGTPDHLRRFADTCSALWEKSIDRFDRGAAPWLHTEEHVYSVAFHELGHGPVNTTDAMRRVWTRPGRLRNARRDDLDLVAWHALSEKGRGLDRLYHDHLHATGAFEPTISDDEFRRRAARHLSIRPTLRDRATFAASRVKAKRRGYRCVPMPG